MKAQARIGKLFAITSSGVLILHLVVALIAGEPIRALFRWDHCIYALFALLSLVSVRCPKIMAAGLQVGILLIMGLLTIYSGEDELYSGIMLLVVAVLVAYNYGAFLHHPVKRIGLSTVCVYVLLVGFPVEGLSNRFLSPIGWIILIYAVLFIIWFIFKDSIEQLKQLDDMEKNKCIQIIREATKTARDATDIANIAIRTLERFEDSIKKGEPDGK